MASKSLYRDFVEAHRKNTKNFNGFMAVLYTSITVVLSFVTSNSTSVFPL